MKKHYSEKSVEEWNVNDFHAYIAAEHRKILKCDYAPMKSWSTEKGLIGNVVGTAKKKGKYSKPLIKSFIDEVLRTYTPSRAYPGISFGFMWSYRQNVLQKLQKREEKRNVSIKKEQENYDEALNWLLN